MVTLIQKLRRRLVRMRHAHVHSVADLSQHVRRVRLHGPELEGLTWLPGQKVKLAIPGGKASYTPARVSPEQGWMEIIFHLHHGDGPMANWAAALQGGEAVDVFGPKKSMPTLQHDIDWAIFLGDETALGLAQALIEGLPRGVAVHGAIELDAQDSDAPRQLELPLEPLARQGSYGDVLRGWLDAHTLPEGPGVIWLSGHAATAFGLRQALLERGVPPQYIKLKAYWSDKGHAHRKALERAG